MINKQFVNSKIFFIKDKYGSWHFKDPEMAILHRENGPAIEYANGTKAWYQNGLRHRLDGPAVEYVNGDKFWYQNGKYHRLDGPAVEYANGNKEYWYQNEWFPDIKTDEQWKKHLKWMKFC